MQTSEEIKQLVKEKYAQIVNDNLPVTDACCAGSCDISSTYSTFAEDYSPLEGYTADADLSLGCGLPTQFAHIQEGNTVVDLGSGAGNDCFVARAEAGNTGRVIGVDMTSAMIDKALANTKKLGYQNVEFVLGEIENLPLEDNLADVVVSNCVMNLVPDKAKAFSETFRILRPGGHFSISDVVLQGNLPDGLQESAELYAGCVAGAIDKEDYLQIIREAGFENIQVQKEREITLSDELLRQHLSSEAVTAFKESNNGIFSVTVYAEKP